MSNKVSLVLTDYNEGDRFSLGVLEYRLSDKLSVISQLLANLRRFHISDINGQIEKLVLFRLIIQILTNLQRSITHVNSGPPRTKNFLESRLV